MGPGAWCGICVLGTRHLPHPSDINSSGQNPTRTVEVVMQIREWGLAPFPRPYPSRQLWYFSKGQHGAGLAHMEFWLCSSCEGKDQLDSPQCQKCDRREGVLSAPRPCHGQGEPKAAALGSESLPGVYLDPVVPSTGYSSSLLSGQGLCLPVGVCPACAPACASINSAF